MSETDIMRAIRAAVNRVPGCRVWRNNVAVAEVRGTKQRFGLAVGSADLIGIAHGKPLAIEVKSATGRLSPEQIAWGECWRRLGGLFVVARSVDEAIRGLSCEL